jgi:hypothetical protein
MHMTEATGRIGSDEWASKKVQNVIPTGQAIPVAMPVATRKVPPGISGGVSTLEPMPPAEKWMNYVPLRPTLAEPTQNLSSGQVMAMERFVAQAATVTNLNPPPEVQEAYLRAILKMQMIVEEISASEVRHHSTEIKLSMEEYDRLNAKKTEQIRQHALALQEQENCSFFCDIVNYFLTATTLVLGTVLVATGVAATAGFFLIAAGGLGLLDRIARDTGAYTTIVAYFTKSRQIQENVASWISSAVLFATIGMGLYGGIASTLNGGFEAARASLSVVDAVKKIEIAVSITSAGANAAKAWKENTIMQVRKSLQLIEGAMEIMKRDLEQEARRSKDTMDALFTITQSTRSMIANFGA